MPFPPSFDHPWDITQPPDTQLANLLGLDIRGLKDDIMQRISLMSGTLANRPSPETINATWGGVDYGLLYFSTDNNKVYQWNGSAWTDITSMIGGGGAGSISFQTNGVANAVQNVENLIAGSGITLTPDLAGGTTIAAGGGGGGVPIAGFDKKDLAVAVGIANHTLVQIDSITVTMPVSGGPWRVLGSYHYWVNGGSTNWQSALFDGSNWFAQAITHPNSSNNSTLNSSELSPVTYTNGQVVTIAAFVYGDGNGTVVKTAAAMGSPGSVTAMGNSHLSLAVMASN